jgi:hypothetical protein
MKETRPVNAEEVREERRASTDGGLATLIEMCSQFQWCMVPGLRRVSSSRRKKVCRPTSQQWRFSREIPGQPGVQLFSHGLLQKTAKALKSHF